jgi:hypothetical protein
MQRSTRTMIAPALINLDRIGIFLLLRSMDLPTKYQKNGIAMASRKCERSSRFADESLFSTNSKYEEEQRKLNWREQPAVW